MTSAALAHDQLLPQEPGGNALGAALAFGAHALLLAALAAATQWRTESHEVVSAELWASVPQAAAPAPPPPPAPAAEPAPAPAPATTSTPPAPAVREPEPPRPADIARQREEARAEKERRNAEAQAERLRKAEAAKERRERAEQRAREAQEAREAREAAAAQAQIDRRRDETLRRMMAQAGAAATEAGPATGAGASGAARDATPSAVYVARLASLIRSQTVFSGDLPGNPAAEVEVRAAANGTILSRRLVKSSGHAAWDDAVLRAIDRVGTLPRDADGRVPPTLIVAFRPKE